MIDQHHLRKLPFLALGLVALMLLSCGKEDTKFSHFPEVGSKAIQQRALALKSNLKVLSIALEPGLEDLEALAYFRLHHGAEVISAYVSNGEAGHNDLSWQYPNYLAATRRSEAEKALSVLGGDIHFMNNPHIVAARDSGYVRDKWPKAEIMGQIDGLIDNYRPDIIMVGNDWVNNAESLRWRLLSQDVVATVENRQGSSKSNGGTSWIVSRVLGQALEGDTVRPGGGAFAVKSTAHVAIAEEAANAYESLQIQRRSWLSANRPVYAVLSAIAAVPDGPVDGHLPPRHTQRVREIARRVEAIADRVLAKNPKSALTAIVGALDTLSIAVGRRFEYPSADQRALFHWKNALEDLRCSILGVEARYDVSEDNLTMSQLTYITVADVRGVDRDGETTVFFGGIDREWAVNEGYKKRFKYLRGDQYRLLTPAELDLTLPVAKNGLAGAKLAKTVTLYVLHDAPTKEKSFIYRTPFKLRFGPKFATEVLTPIVRMVPGEKLILRLTNYSRDGVRDTVEVKHEQVDSMPGLFRLNEKDGTYTDTLSLIWKDNPPEGNYLFPIEIDGFEVANFAARQFSTQLDSTKRVGYISAQAPDALGPTLRRLGAQFAKINPDRDIPASLADLDVLIVDGHTLNQAGSLQQRKSDLDAFVSNGGHLIYLAQDAAAWEQSALWEGITVIPNQRFDERFPVNYEAEHPLLSSPNTIEAADWEGWIFRRAFNTAKVQAGSAVESPVKTGEGDPLILTEKRGSGRVTYVALALRFQLANIHQGAFRLLANLISD